MKLKLSVLFSILLFMSSCANWLDVVPSDTMVETELFKDATGYRNALNGVYKQISKPELYGKEMTWGFMDVMAYRYQTGTTGIASMRPYYLAFFNYNYENNDVKKYFANIWEKSYNTITNCNNIIEKISYEKPIKFSLGQSEIDLIKGEALALRAFIHFDMLRLFAPSTKNDDGKAYVPYYEKYPSHGEARLTNEELKVRIIRDLKEARDLVVNFDTLERTHLPWLGPTYRFESKKGTGDQTDDIFFAFRGYRMTYPAVTAILARVYNYFEMHDEAKIEAEKVINMRFPECNGGYAPFFFSTREQIETQADVMSTNDLIFTLSYPKKFDDFLFHTDTKNNETLVLRDFAKLFDDGADFRKFTASATDGKNYFSLKNIGKSGTSYDKISDMIPVIRLSEMYYIIAEYHSSKGDFAASATTLDVVRSGRGCKVGLLSIKDKTSFETELINEAKREFISEGQLFYYYKKMNKLISTKMKPEHFVFPLPDSEKINF